MTLDAIKTVAVLGAGTMGNGIAHVFAKAGFSVILRDVQTRFLDRALETIAKNLDREIKRGKVAEAEKPEILGRIHPTTNMTPLGRADFGEGDACGLAAARAAAAGDVVAWAAAGGVVALTGVGVTALAAATSRPDRFLGMHFMNPVPVMVLVEVIRALQTSDATFTTTLALCEKIEKKPVAVNDSPGFVSNRVLMPLINEAAYCVMEGVADAQAVDAVMKMGMNHPIGPLELADLIGLDVCLDVMEVLHTGFADSKYRPCPLLRKMVSAGWLGRKSGRGFYTYPG